MFQITIDDKFVKVYLHFSSTLQFDEFDDFFTKCFKLTIDKKIVKLCLHFSSTLQFDEFDDFFYKMCQINNRRKKSSKCAYILAEKCSSHFNLTNFLANNFQNSNFVHKTM